MRQFLQKNLGRVVRRLMMLADWMRYRGSIGSFRRLSESLPPADQGSLLIVSGRGMNVVWAQLWPILGLALATKGYKVKVVTTRSQRLLNAYYRLLGAELIHFDGLRDAVKSTSDDALQTRIGGLRSFEDYAGYVHDEAPVGQIALSTYSRHVGTGLIDISRPDVSGYVRHWIHEIVLTMRIASYLYEEHGVKILFFSEVFMEEYGAFYYAAIKRRLNIIRCAGTVRDDAFIFQHLSRTNDRIHHSSIDRSTWDRLASGGDIDRIDTELRQNFEDRYGEKWHRSRRNHPGTRIIDVGTARARLGIRPGRKVAVIYSHILYDTLFFFGTDLFKDYAEWLVESVRAAMANPNVDWLIKVHPSNLWRGELGTLLKGRYEEEQLLERQLGALPPHVRIVPADTPINPLTWFQLADYGITVRGTSGLEMATLGKTVVTAGTGRYEGNGFTVDPPDADSYLALLRGIHELAQPAASQVDLAKRYAHAIFVLKPFPLPSMQPRLRCGLREVRASDDLVYMPGEFAGHALPPDLARFAEWAVHPEQRDLLSGPA